MDILDRFTSGLRDAMVSPGSKTDFVMKHYKPILGGVAGAYLLSKILPSLYNYSHTERDEEAQANHSYLLQMIAENEARQTAAINPFGPKRDTYQYV